MLIYSPKAHCSFPAAVEDWFMSLGVGLLTFASLETIGIYFGLGKCPVGKLHRPPGSWGEGWWLAITLAKSHDLNFFFLNQFLMFVFSS